MSRPPLPITAVNSPSKSKLCDSRGRIISPSWPTSVSVNDFVAGIKGKFEPPLGYKIDEVTRVQDEITTLDAAETQRWQRAANGVRARESRMMRRSGLPPNWAKAAMCWTM